MGTRARRWASEAPRLLERDGEAARLTTLVSAAGKERGAVVVVEGPPGVGKTELLRLVGGLAEEAGFDVLTARGDELERGFAFGVVRQLFEPRMAELAREDRDAVLSGAAALAATLVDPDQMPSPPPPAADPFPLLHGLYWLVAGLAERGPLALIVDDAHWADGPSLWWLSYLSRRLDGVGALLVLAARSTAPEAPVDAVEVIKVQPEVTVLRPAPLSEPASAALLAEMFDADPVPELARTAHAVTGGNPFLLSEVGRSLAAEGLAPDGDAAQRLHQLTPATVTRRVSVRLAHLDDDARGLATAVAVLGEDAELRHAAALAGLQPARALAAADALAAAGFCEVDAGHGAALLRFAHPLIRQVVHAELHDGQRAGYHLEAARLLAAESGSTERAAAHLMKTVAAGDPWVVEVLRSAAADAMAASAPEIAVSYLRRAMAEPPACDARPAVLLALGQAEAQALDPRAVVDLEAAARGSRDPMQQGAALGALGFAHYLRGDAASAAATTREALSQIPAGGGGEVEAQLLLSYGLPGRAVPALVDEVTALLGQPRAGPRGEPTLAELVRVCLAALDDVLRGQPGRAADRLAWVDERADRLRGDDMVPVSAGLGCFQALVGHHRRAEANLERALESARRHGNRLHLGMALEGRTYLRWRRGDLAGAIAEADTLLALTEELDGGMRTPLTATVRAVQSVCLVERGDHEAAAATLDVPADVLDRLTGTWGWVWLPYGQARLALARGDWTQAHQRALTAGERALAIQAPSASYLPWRSLAARAAAAGGDRETGRRLAREELDCARQEGSTRAIGLALTALGVIEPAAPGVELLDQAVAALSGTADRVGHARALCEFGAALRRANHRRDARPVLATALELARGCGAVPLMERAHDELRATGARPRSLVFTGVESLTPRERQAAELATQGRSNPEIAQALFVTRKTVETHLSSVYRKLEVHSRQELAKALATVEPTGAPRRRR